MGWLEGQTAIVTGGASGLGRAVVDRFVQEGARVVVLDRSTDHLAKLKADHDRRTVVGVKGDVTSPAANEKAVATAVKNFGQLDVFVGNAGIWDYSIPL
ncbi:MAG TPA: SDR family NAD(P)-dependent oxidoreductase, partial [Acidimicrobiia bacterium]|nr:SDR family NAD(P)-dependent oxidoreductase [Acidimicrobiia bacterium]